jgi:ribosomal protein S11
MFVGKRRRTKVASDILAEEISDVIKSKGISNVFVFFHGYKFFRIKVSFLRKLARSDLNIGWVFNDIRRPFGGCYLDKKKRK